MPNTAVDGVPLSATVLEPPTDRHLGGTVLGVAYARVDEPEAVAGLNGEGLCVVVHGRPRYRDGKGSFAAGNESGTGYELALSA